MSIEFIAFVIIFLCLKKKWWKCFSQEYLIIQGKNIRENKTLVLSAIFLVLLVVFVAIPTLSTYKITSSVSEITIWDGTVASSYAGGNGTEESPYIISNGSELMFLANQLETETDYEGKYFVLNDDIILNDGIFNYTKDNGIKYLKSEKN